MRPLVGGMLLVGAFAAVFLLGGKALGVWEPLPVATPAAAQSPLPQTASFKGPKPSRMTTDRKKAGVGRKKDRHAPREHLRRNDMATARQAVLRLSDMRGHWKPARPSSEQGGGCRGNDPDFSRFTITGKAHSAFGGGDSFIESRVKLFANAGQAEQYFAAAYNRTFLRCIRDGVKRWLAEGGLRPRVVDARFSTGPPVGVQTAVYVVDYVITTHRGTRYDYPIDVITFRTGRAVARLSFASIPSDDGYRPCACELYEARLVESRLGRP